MYAIIFREIFSFTDADYFEDNESNSIPGKSSSIPCLFAKLRTYFAIGIAHF
jgi:hypothetical protein